MSGAGVGWAGGGTRAEDPKTQGAEERHERRGDTIWSRCLGLGWRPGSTSHPTYLFPHAPSQSLLAPGGPPPNPEGH